MLLDDFLCIAESCARRTDSSHFSAHPNQVFDLDGNFISVVKMQSPVDRPSGLYVSPKKHSARCELREGRGWHLPADLSGEAIGPATAPVQYKI